MPASFARRALDTLADADRRYRDRRTAEGFGADRLADLGVASRRDLFARMR